MTYKQLAGYSRSRKRSVRTEALNKKLCWYVTLPYVTMEISIQVIFLQAFWIKTIISDI